VEKENKELVTRVFERTAQGDMQAMSEVMAEDFRWVFPGSWSWSGTWEPKDVVVHGLLRPLMTQLGGVYRLTADFVLADGDRVVVQARGDGTTTAGEPYRQTYCFVFRVADGLLTEVIEHCDTALVERVLTTPVR
jgi:ketosteroid isomerase-like protein